MNCGGGTGVAATCAGATGFEGCAGAGGFWVWLAFEVDGDGDAAICARMYGGSGTGDSFSGIYIHVSYLSGL